MLKKYKIIIYVLGILFFVWISIFILRKFNSISCDIIVPSNFAGNAIILYDYKKVYKIKSKKIKIIIPENGISFYVLKNTNTKIKFNYFIKHNNKIIKYSENNHLKIKLEGFAEGSFTYYKNNDTIKAGYISFRVLHNGIWNDTLKSEDEMFDFIQINDKVPS